jgi:hypothetical protein
LAILLHGFGRLEWKTSNGKYPTHNTRRGRSQYHLALGRTSTDIDLQRFNISTSTRLFINDFSSFQKKVTKSQQLMQIGIQIFFFVAASQKVSDALNSISLVFTVDLLEISKVLH